MTKKLLFCLIVCLLISPLVMAKPLGQDDAVELCAEGVALFEAGDYSEALPLLEAGFEARETANFASLDDLGICAIDLGIVRYMVSKLNGALDAYTIALDIFKKTGNEPYKGTTYANIGTIHVDQGNYLEALDYYEQALIIMREEGDFIGEERILIGFGLVYENQGYYGKALEYYNVALEINEKIKDKSGKVGILNNMGKLYNAQGFTDEALKYYEQALAISKNLEDPITESTIYNNIGSVYNNQGDYEKALESYKIALTISQEIKNEAIEGATHNNIGETYHTQNKYEEALQSFTTALAISQRLENPIMESLIFFNIGRLYDSQNHYEKALQHYEQALIISKDIKNKTTEQKILNTIGFLYVNQYNYKKASQYYNDALIISQELGNRVLEGKVLNDIGLMYNEQGRYGKALWYYEKALIISQEIKNPDMNGTTLNNIGLIYDYQGRYEDALPYYEEALTIFETIGNKLMEGTVHNNIGAIHNVQGQHKEALQCYEDALSIIREVGDKILEGRFLNNIGSVYNNQKYYDKALQYYQDSLSINNEINNLIDQGNVLNNIGIVYQSQGHYTEALNYFKQALQISNKTNNQLTTAGVLNNIGSVYLNQNHFAEAMKQYQQSMYILDELRLLSNSDQSRASFIAQYINPYNQSVILHHKLNDPIQAFHTSERSRSRTFLDSLATGYVQFNNNELQALYQAESEAYQYRQVAQNNLAKAKAQNDPQLITALEQELATAQTTYQQALDDIEAHGGFLETLIPGRSNQHILTVEQVQSYLDEQTTLLSYFVLEDQTLAFLITPNSFEVVALEVSQQDLLIQMRAFQKFPAGTDPNDPIPDSFTTLYQWLIAPLKDKLNTPHLAIIPHTILHYLPFAALTDGERFLSDDYVLSTLPNASSLPFIQQNANHPLTNPLILGNPTLSTTQIETANLYPLLHAEDEAKAIAALYQTPSILNEEATEKVVRDQVSKAGILHIAAHGRYNTVAPLQSALYLTESNGPEPNNDVELDTTKDGLLKTEEIYSLDLNQTGLVILSACETQLGTLEDKLLVNAGDELVSMTRAFFFAGTPTIIASLWPVDDEATALLMKHFYTNLQNGLGKAQALQHAQQTVREQYPNPYYWAGFVLSGDGGTIKEVTKDNEATNPIETDPPTPETKGNCLALMVPLVLMGGVVVRRRGRA